MITGMAEGYPSFLYILGQILEQFENMKKYKKIHVIKPNIVLTDYMTLHIIKI